MIRSKTTFCRTQVGLLATATGLLLGLMACSTEPAPEEPLFQAPANFPQPIYLFENNPLTKEGVELGRMLFYDGRLSRDGTISCAECHNQAYAFTHHGHDVSHGIDNRLGTRNSLPLQNLAWSREFMWDGGVFDLDMFPIVPIENHVEMDEKVANVLDKLRADDTYRKQFQKVYGSEDVTTARFLQALSQFMLTMVSGNSRYDKYVRNESGNGAMLTADELAGLNLFKSKGCAGCHAGELFTDQSYRNNGLSLAFGEDEGRAHITEKAEDRYTFKVPSLRNVEHTSPYMHDGRFRTLEAVLKHYAEDVDDTPNLDPLLKQKDQLGQARPGQSKPGQSRLGIALTTDEQAKLIAFLKTLTDTDFLTNPKFAPK
jgi:cytochrome c peroxidase